MPDDLRQHFVVEARELAEQLMAGVLHAERSGAVTSDQRRHLLRLAHTLKGAARVVKEAAIGDMAHAIEDLLAATGERLEPTHASRLLGLIDEILANVPHSAPAGAAAATPAVPAFDEAGRAVRIDLSEIDNALERVADLAARCGVLQADLSRAGLTQPLASAERLAVEMAELRSHLHQMRLAPATSLLVAVERAVRDAAQAAGVLVSFTASGGDHRMDADVLVTVRDALIQLARNAVAHGIEPAADRAARGKPPEGRIELTIERRGGNVAFTVGDDGRGLDLDALRRAAIAAGHRGSLGEHDLVGLLLAGGLTTRRAVTQISGRGVGLDVVRAIVARLHGRMALRHAPGRGVQVELVLPVSLRSLPCLRMESGDAAALLPLDAVRGTLRLACAGIVVIEGQRRLSVNGHTVPLVDLTSVLAQTSAAPPANRVAAIVASSTGTLALAAERFGEAAVAVAEALPPLAGAAPVIRGVALEADGRVVPVLEPDALPRRRTDHPAPADPMRVPRVLVVDDSVTTRMLEQSILESAGFQVETVGSAEEALTRAAQTTYDLFIVDVEMPGMNGFEFVAATRADDALSNTPAILVTSRGSEEDRRRGLDAGARGYVVKGEFDQDAFLALVRGLVG